MKKLAILLALLIIPCSAFGLEMLNDNALNDVTGQAGVSIAIDDIQLFLNIGKIAYIDCDGFDSMSGYGTCTGAAGAVALSNFQIDVVNINAITATLAGTSDLRSTACGTIDLIWDYGTAATAGTCTIVDPLNLTDTATLGLDNYAMFEADALSIAFVPKVLTIDVTSKLPTATDGFQYLYNGLVASELTAALTAAGHPTPAAAAAVLTNAMTMGGVLIGLPTVEIYINELIMTPGFDADVNGSVNNVYNDDDGIMLATPGDVSKPRDYGTIYMKGITFSVLSGWLEIAPH